MKNNYTTPRRTSGFTLPVILLISVGLMIVALSLVQSTASIRDSLSDQYLNRIATEAAEAGVKYANSCLNNNSLIQSWDATNGKPLTQTTDCTGTVQVSAPAYLMTSGTYRTVFNVGNLETTRADGAVTVSSKGTAHVLNAGGATIRSYDVTLKQLVSWQKFEASKSYSGARRTCGIISGEVYCWGGNNAGQLGDGTTNDSLVPVKVIQESGVLAGKKVDDMFTAYYHNCALATGNVYCWGDNSSYQLGTNNTTDSYKPVLVQGLLAGKTVTDVGGTYNTSCAIAAGKIYCWGQPNIERNGNYDSTGTNSAGTNGSYIRVPTLVTSTNLDAAYGAGNYHAIKLSTSGSASQTMCAIINNTSSLTNGDAWCWGNNEVGQIGNGSTTGAKIPTKVTTTGVLSAKTVTDISQDGGTGSNSSSHTCVVASDAKAYCWGENYTGGIGDGTTVDKSLPTAVNTTGALSGKSVTGINVGIYHTCALASGNAYCWGGGSFGQLGNGATSNSSLPVLIDQTVLAGKTITSIGGGTNRGCVVADLKSYCWGLNNQGQIGDGTTTDRNVPTESVYLRPKAPAFIF